MPIYQPQQRSFLDLELDAMVEAVEGSLVWLLVNYADHALPEWLLRHWRRGKTRMGRPAWSARTLATLLLLRWSDEGMGRETACRRAESDVLWRYAMGLPPRTGTPSERTVRDFEAWLLETHEDTGMTRTEALHRHIVHLARWSASTRGNRPPKWVLDSTPMWCFGAVLDTVRLLGDGLRKLGRAWARALKVPLLVVSRDLKLPIMLARSTKGALRINWRDKDARTAAVSGLANDVARVVGVIGSRLHELAHRPALQAQVSALCDLLLRVIEQDLEQDADGNWQIARRVAEGRVVSLTDPEARHGHKSRSESFWGFKLNVLGDAVSGVVAALSVSPGNSHDAAPGHALLATAQEMEVGVTRVLADTAYGGIESRLHILSLGIQLVAPPPAGAPPGERLSKNAFDIDFENGAARCPNGVSTSVLEQTGGKVPTPAFRWPVEACSSCPLQAKCLDQPIGNPKDAPGGRPRKGKRLVLDRWERERREARATWEDPEVQAEYRHRSTGERLHFQLIQHGARLARARGRRAAQLQVQLIAMVVNLGILARNLADAIAETRARAPAKLPGKPRRAINRASPGVQLSLLT